MNTLRNFALLPLLILTSCASLVPVADDSEDGANSPQDRPGLPVTPETVPSFSQDQFSHPSDITNPRFPLPPGRTLRYRSEDGSEEILIEILSETREVAGLNCRVVRDRVYVDGLVIEDTFDWYAQDDAGNVWYMGEEVSDFTYDDQGALLSVEHPGAWETLRDIAGIGVLALPGYIMPANPTLGLTYHQEYYKGDAEDYAEIDQVDAVIELEDGSTYTVIRSHDLSTLDATIDSFKYYAAGIGVVLEEGQDGERVELVEVIEP